MAVRTIACQALLCRRRKRSAWVDATYVGNVARFINSHCEPNCRVEAVPVDTITALDSDDLSGADREQFQRLLIISNRLIPKGTEVTIQYE